MHDVTAIGELLIDFATINEDEDGYPTMAAKPGGAPGNYLAALAEYGISTALLAKVGDDSFGKKLINTIEKAGIATSGIVLDNTAFTTLAFVTFDDKGDRSFSFARKPGADILLRWDEIKRSLIEEARVFHFGTLSLTDEPIRGTTQKSVMYAKEKGKIITFDPNLRKPLWRSSEEAKEQILWGLTQADIVKISDEEVSFLWDCSIQEGTDILLEQYGVKLAMITLGPDGCHLQNKNGSIYVKSPPVKTVDTTGAGDIFGGAAVSRILKKGKLPEELTLDDLQDVAMFATHAASLSTEKMGGIPSIPPEEKVIQAIQRAY